MSLTAFILVHPSTRESKWRYIMQKINLRELYPDVYKTNVFVDVAEEVVAAIRGQEQDDAAYERRAWMAVSCISAAYTSSRSSFCSRTSSGVSGRLRASFSMPSSRFRE